MNIDFRACLSQNNKHKSQRWGGAPTNHTAKQIQLRKAVNQSFLLDMMFIPVFMKIILDIC